MVSSTGGEQSQESLVQETLTRAANILLTAQSALACRTFRSKIRQASNSAPDCMNIEQSRWSDRDQRQHRFVQSPFVVPGRPFCPSLVKRASRRAIKGLIPLFALMLLFAPTAFSQTPLDAGALQQQLERERIAPLPRNLAPEATPAPVPMKPVPGFTVTVGSFGFAGNTLLSAEQLAPAVAGYLNRPLDFGQLQAAAASVAKTYRDAGWVVRAYLPAQDVATGVVTIQIVEAVFGGAYIEGKPKRLSKERILKTVAAQQEKGRKLNANAFDRALLLADDLPGVVVSGVLRAGVAEGETDLVMKVADETLYAGEASLDNFGSRSSGSERITGNLYLMSPLGLGDQVSANLMRSKGSTFGRLGITLPVGVKGWRSGASASRLDYELVGSDFAALGGGGSSSTLGLEASYPLIRSRQKNLYLGINFDHKNFDNESLGTTSSRYVTYGLGVSLNGNLFDNLGGGGANSGSLALINGSLNLGTLDVGENPALDGGYSKLRYSLSRQQAIDKKWSIYVAVTGQESRDALDSSERFYLGGVGGVRAYPASEGSGNSGHLTTLELRGRLPMGITLIGFHDHGHVRSGAGTPDYGLQGMGLALAWRNNFGINLNATWARRLGNNPNPTASGRDQDGSLTKNRFWLSVGMSF